MENKKEDFQRGIYKLATLLLVAFISQSDDSAESVPCVAL